jgi:hydroxymethylpyrimidine/phosphomethylpyrimidine kinase
MEKEHFKGAQENRKKEYRKPSLISIAGLDPSGCAGLLLDVRVIRALGFHPCGVVTALTFQNTCRGYGFEQVSPSVVEKQLNSILEDKLVAGVKIGLLNSVEVAEVVANLLKDYEFDNRGPVVWDPVFKSTTKLEFFNESFVGVAESLSAIVDVATPNVEEAELLSGVKINERTSAEKAAMIISRKLNSAVVITGGKLNGIDVVFDGKKAFTVEAEFSPVEIRGTGCIYSSALTCYLSKGESLEDGARLSRLYLLESVKRARLTGKCLPCSDPVLNFD